MATTAEKTKAEVLLELADRCEKATGPDRGLDIAIYRALSYIGHHGWHPMDRDAAPRYTACLDAALTLVPEGSLWSVCDMEHGPFAQVIRPMPGGGFVDGLTSAASDRPALALCAAALRARAAMET